MESKIILYLQIIQSLNKALIDILVSMNIHKSDINKYKVLANEYLILCNQVLVNTDLIQNEIRRMMTHAGNILDNL